VKLRQGSLGHHASPQQSAIRVFRAGRPEGEIDMKIDETLEMAYPQKLARDIIIGIADPINEHLVKLIAF
jgi:hypothetical protein